MKMIKSSVLALGLLFGLTQQALAEQESGIDDYMIERTQASCQNSDPEFTAWFFNQTENVPQIHQILGPVRDQGRTGQCYALAASDMITSQIHVRVSGAQVAHLYYQKSFTGTVQRLFGNNAGGFIGSAIGAAEGQSLCAENTPVTLAEDPNPNAQENFCNNPEAQIKNLSVRTQTTHGVGIGHQLFSVMDQSLNRKKIVGVAYRAQDIFTGFQISAFNSYANHASTVVARQWNPRSSTCDYIIRNSWGEGCAPSLALCNRGYYSVPEVLMDKALQAVSYFK
jgi:hypothetical protein